MSLDSAKNFAKVTVSTGYNAAAVSIALVAGHGSRVPTAPVNGVWWNATDYADPADDPNVEIIRVTARTDDTLTISRAQEGTLASAKNTPDKTYRIIFGPTAKLIADITTDIATVAAALVAHGTNTSNPHSVTKSQVGLGDVQDFGIASQVEAEAGSASNKYMTPQRVKQLLDAQAWTSWTPTWTGLTIGNAVVLGRYTRIGKLVFFKLTVTFGTTTSFSGEFTFTLPVQAAANYFDALGNATFFDSSAAFVGVGYVIWKSATTGAVRSFTVSGGNVSWSTVNNTSPFTWDDPDTFAVEGFYEAA